MVVTLAKILEVKNITSNIFQIKIFCPGVVEKANPGQFLHIRCSDSLSPLLRRPISIAGIDKKAKTLNIIFKVVGEGTRLLSKKRPGDDLDILGPLGKGFPIDKANKNIVFVAGGIGIAPLLFLAEKIEAVSLENSVAIIGATTAKELIGVDHLKVLGINVISTTDDGSEGLQGFPTDVLKDYLQETTPDIIYACGPKPLLSKVKEIANASRIPAYVSLEERMGCGIGACLGCAVKVEGQNTYKKVCKDGPVFNANEIII
jgi:dihydroorotate dehydrogenase electron transfer subunit